MSPILRSLVAAATVLVCAAGWRGPIAVVSALSYRFRSEVHKSTDFFCQWANHKEYCKRQGYQCYFVVDSHGREGKDRSPWNTIISRDPFRVSPQWFKIHVLRIVLPKFAAVLLLNPDTVIWDLDRPLQPALAAARSRWWVIADTKVISTHALIVKNTHRSRVMVEHLWDLRHVCPSCPRGEQCAVHVLLAELLFDWALQNRRVDFYVANDKNGAPCCSPASHCAYPNADIKDRNPSPSFSAQGCTWNWLTAMPEEVKATHRNVYWAPNTSFPNILHPVRKQVSCQTFYPSFDPSRKTDPGRITTTALIGILTKKRNYSPLIDQTPWQLSARPAEGYIGANISGLRPRSQYRYCRVVALPAAH
eukprot:TRINITY_DN5866_c0_g1_i1.p1 TRINITY_DN5866_c0_g1~~TRINITY_DN5866_c0_g1_i1.p1  ORF type:complete len:391 (+),score=58.68 TRINITY_DN5866_c0_g1_i1:86-1174(+)